jgi:WD40 repeat protein
VESHQDMLLTRRQMLRGLGIVTLSVGAGFGLLSCGGPTGPVTVIPSATPTPPPKPRAGAPATLVRAVLYSTGPAYGIAYSSDSKSLATAGLDKVVRSWNAIDGGLAVNTFMGLPDVGISITYSPDNKQLAASTIPASATSPSISVWDATKDQTQPQFSLTGPTDRVNSIAWSPNGKNLASASEDSTVMIWDATKAGTPLLTLKDTNGQISVAWSPDSTRVASGCSDHTAKIWDAVKGGKALSTFSGHTDRVRSVAWSPDGTQLLTGSDDQTLKVWSVADASKPLMTLTGHKGRVSSVGWAPNGKYLGSGSDDGSVKIWDAKNGGDALITLVPTGSNQFAQCIAWSPDSSAIAASYPDGKVWIWEFVTV